MTKPSVIMHLTQDELSILYSALRQRACNANKLTQELRERGFSASARRAYASYASTAALAQRVRKHLPLDPDYLD